VVQGCSDILQWSQDHRLEFPDLSDLAKNARNTFCVMAIGAASELVFIIDGHVVNSTRINLKSSPVYGILFFNSAVKLREKP